MMPLAIAISFPGGRFHATAWGRHVNEGAPEWPPAPWRLLRALVAVWKRALSDDPLVNAHLPAAIAKLAAPPLYKLPPAVLGHTRHYMTQKQRGDTALVFDGFIALSSDQELGVFWPDADLMPEEKEALGRVLNRLNYLGRAEGWCVARLCADWDALQGEVCSWVDDLTGKIAGPVAASTESVRLLCLDAATWNTWDYCRRAHVPDPKWNLLAETADLHADGWSDPPGSRWITYLRPAQALAPPPPAGHRSIRSASRPRLVRFALDGAVLPRIAETVYVAELARRRVQGIFGRLFDAASSPVLSGKRADGSRLEEHRHAFFLPTDEDQDGKLDHIILFSPDGFGWQEMRALDAWRETRGPGSIILSVVWMGTDEECSEPSRTWRSATPFIPTRHYKERGAQRDTFAREHLAEVNLREELARRGLPAPVRVTLLRELALSGGRSMNWRDFRQQRVLGDGRRGHEFGKGFQVEFAEPVAGPVMMGYGCHFGLGRFVPEPDHP